MKQSDEARLVALACAIVDGARTVQVPADSTNRNVSVGSVGPFLAEITVVVRGPLDRLRDLLLDIGAMEPTQ